MKLKELQIFNRAPFDNLRLTFGNSNIAILSGINGVGKTTILSYVVDAFYEYAKKGFENSFEGISNKFYRVSSGLTVMRAGKISFVYLRFENEGKTIDYIDVRNLGTEEEYNTSLQIESPITYSQLKAEMGSDTVAKYFNVSDREEVLKCFNSNLLTYFPAYRYEQPGYLNDVYNISLKFKTKSEFSGYLKNPIEVTTGLEDIVNWIMDIVMDTYLYHEKHKAEEVLTNINKIFSELLKPKVKMPVRVGIGPRQYGATRIQIVKQIDGTQIYPSIFNMSSGEHALICLFIELLRQADRLGTTFNQVNGVVLIDEIDKHLHIKMQKDVLPTLIKLFPNVQFIVTSHSPFLNLGFAGELDDFYKIYDMDNGGISCKPQNNTLFEEVYQILISENERFAKKYNQLCEEIEGTTTPLIITEGKTDWKHLKAAMKSLEIDDLDVSFYEYTENMGDNTLLNLLKQFAITSPNRKIIGMFDRDNDDICKVTSENVSSYVELSKNIYIFSIPTVNETVYGKYTSIEHYYLKDQLLKQDENGRRLFLGEEFYESGYSKCRRYHTRCKGVQNKVTVNGIIDDKVYDLEKDPHFKTSIALPKDDFAQMILGEDKFAEGFDFSEFSKIFDVIREIVKA